MTPYQEAVIQEKKRRKIEPKIVAYITTHPADEDELLDMGELGIAHATWHGTASTSGLLGHYEVDWYAHPKLVPELK
jgi:hypothetical protein